MKTSLLDTKLYIPSLRPEFITRMRLLNLIEAGLQGKLTLISASAGFGKSTLVAMWARKSKALLGWVSLDAQDNDPVLFLAYIFTAIYSVGQVGDSVLAEIQSSQRPSDEAILKAWINELANHPSKLTLVLDDYHVIENPTIHQHIEFLLEHLPPNFHLIVITRSDPNLQLARIRASGHLTEIREADLRFTESETSQFLESVIGLHLSPQNISALERRTEGWAVGLQLAGLALQGREDVDEFVSNFTGGHQFILDYLTEEVYEQQSEEIQEFLIQTCILERFCASLCNAVTGKQNGEATIELLSKWNLFVIPLDEYRQWYRYHHLFVELLRYKLDQLPADRVVEFHERASSWYAENDLISEAVSHAMAAKNFNRAADLIEPVTSLLIGRGEIKTVHDWIETFPKTFLKKRPRLCITLAWVFNLNNTGTAIEPLLQDAERALDEAGYDETTEAEVRGHATTLRGYAALQQNNPPQALQHMTNALAWLPEEELYMRSIVSFTQGVILKRGCVWGAAEETLKVAEKYGRASGNYSIALGSRIHLIEMLIIQGRLRGAAKHCEEAIEYYLPRQKGNRLPNLGFVYTKLGEIQYDWNNLEAAGENLTHGLELSSRIIAAWAWRRDGLVYLSRLKVVKGDPEAAQTLLDQAINVNENMQDLYDKMDMSFAQTRLWLMQGNLTAAARWQRDIQAQSDRRSELVDVMIARTLIAQGEGQKALDILSPHCEAAQATGRNTLLIEILILQASAHYIKKNPMMACTTLMEALSLAEVEGFVRIFVEAGEPIAKVLRQLRQRPEDFASKENFLVSQKFITRLLSAFPDHGDSNSLLNEREEEILHLLAAGMKTPEIAAELFLSNNTIKWYLKNIYSKLGVHNRADAIERGRRLNLNS